MAVESTMQEIGSQAPDFRLPVAGGGEVSLAEFADAPVLLVAFLSNHCPYVKHVRAELAKLTRQYMEAGVAVVGINANDWDAYPDDSPERMAQEVADVGYPFPYCYDESQETAKAYGAACTPDFFVFDDDRRLVYRGQMDDSRPGNDNPVTGGDLRAALDAALAGRPVPAEQYPSVGCNVKWRPGNAPAYAQ